MLVRFFASVLLFGCGGRGIGSPLDSGTQVDAGRDAEPDSRDGALSDAAICDIPDASLPEESERYLDAAVPGTCSNAPAMGCPGEAPYCCRGDWSKGWDYCWSAPFFTCTEHPQPGRFEEQDCFGPSDPACPCEKPFCCGAGSLTGCSDHELYGWGCRPTAVP